ncbi:hypothetical protein [Arthrospiribacter ruber]|uniref:Secreted protein n=1 Tax=Arthrospiribacter ruber TaxID=2487934 RepID=A0A951J5C6_9BACT|nr:hypothetical protein [Arthrospiribacter ruber]MBW3470153.1 hypothetical protein [Arthrospiribacter ruber]
MKKLLFLFSVLMMTICITSLLANDESLPGDNPDLMTAAAVQIKNGNGDVIGTSCVHCDAGGSCLVVTCL